MKKLFWSIYASCPSYANFLYLQKSRADILGQDILFGLCWLWPFHLCWKFPVHLSPSPNFKSMLITAELLLSIHPQFHGLEQYYLLKTKHQSLSALSETTSILWSYVLLLGKNHCRALPEGKRDQSEKLWNCTTLGLKVELQLAMKSLCKALQWGTKRNSS